MKKLFLLLLTSVVAVGPISAQNQTKDSAAAAPLNGKEFLLSYYQQTFDNLKKSVEGLTAAQLQFKPAADRWSISQCLEHIVLTEKMIFDYAVKGLEAPANPEKRKEIKTTDEGIIKMINDRSFKAKASADVTGTGKYVDANVALNDLQNGRKPILDFINAANLNDLRNHVSDTPGGPADGYQSFLFIAGHTSRHTAQINEVKADPNFPK